MNFTTLCCLILNILEPLFLERESSSSIVSLGVLILVPRSNSDASGSDSSSFWLMLDRSVMILLAFLLLEGAEFVRGMAKTQVSTGRHRSQKVPEQGDVYRSPGRFKSQSLYCTARPPLQPRESETLSAGLPQC